MILSNFNNLAFSTKLPTTGESDLVHPTSLATFAEVFGTLNLTTNTAMEGVPHNEQRLQDAIKYYTNKGAIRSMLGRKRHVTLTTVNNHKTFFIKKFVPRPVRRIVPYSYFGIIIHLPLESDVEQTYVSTSLTASIAHLGLKAHVQFHEWNADHDQEMA